MKDGTTGFEVYRVSIWDVKLSLFNCAEIKWGFELFGFTWGDLFCSFLWCICSADTLKQLKGQAMGENVAKITSVSLHVLSTLLQ